MRRFLLAIFCCLIFGAATSAQDFGRTPSGFSGDGFGRAGFQQYSASRGPMFTPMMAVVNLSSSGTGASFGGAISYTAPGGLSGGAVRGIPIPVGGTISGLYTNLTNENTGATVKDNINSTDGIITCTYTPTSAPFFCTDTSHSEAINAGDIFQWHWTYSGGTPATWNQPASSAGPQQISYLFQSSDGQGVLLGGPTGITGTNTYIGPSGTGTSTEATTSAIMPVSGTLNSLYITTNGTAEGTDAHTYTICKNGTGTCLGSPTSGIWCQPTAVTGKGCCVDVNPTGKHVGGPSGPSCTSTSPMNFVAGDTISVQIQCPGTCTTTMIVGVSMSYTPAVAGQAILTAETSTNTSLTAWIPFSGNLVATTQVNYGLTPSLGGRTLTFSKLIACSDHNPGASNAWAITSQSSAVASPPPTNVTGATTASITSTAACPGANSGTLIAGNQDTTNSWTAASGTLVDNNKAPIGSPATGSGNYKFSMAAVIQ